MWDQITSKPTIVTFVKKLELKRSAKTVLCIFNKDEMERVSREGMRR